MTDVYLRKVDGPRAVTLPDGRILSRGDLPPRETRRWVASRKLLVVQAVAYGIVTEAEILERYGLSAEEFQEWTRAVALHGAAALKVTTLQKFRQL
jgi:Protein of unknown function (DUF1153)